MSATEARQRQKQWKNTSKVYKGKSEIQCFEFIKINFMMLL